MAGLGQFRLYQIVGFLIFVVVTATMVVSFQNCSDADFFCMDARVRSDDPPLRIFAPRKVETPRIYQSGKARAVVVPTATENRSQRAQITIWQPIGLEDVAIKITVEEGRGIIYFDGINFWHPDLFRDGETCALESKAGYFSEIKIPPIPTVGSQPR